MFRKICSNWIESLLVGSGVLVGFLGHEVFSPLPPAARPAGAALIETRPGPQPVTVFEGFELEWLDRSRLILRLKPVPLSEDVGPTT